MKEKTVVLVTPYKNPDLDGTACAFAYAEYLQKAGRNAMAAIFGTPSREAQFVLKIFNIPPLKDAEEIVDDVNKIIIVDASDMRGLSDKINPEKVIEIIDHRKVHEAHTFPKAKAQIELVGSAATLIAEKFFNEKTQISKESAVLLFSAIVSNTVNFQANVTTKRDHTMAEWLKTKFVVPQNYVHEMFADKSNHEELLHQVFDDDLAAFQFNGFSLGIAQLEIIEVDRFIDNNLEKIKENLSKIKKEKSFDFVFLTCIDLEKAFNKLIVIDDKTKRMLEQALDVSFEKRVARMAGIMMRKEIVPLIKEILETS